MKPQRDAAVEGGETAQQGVQMVRARQDVERGGEAAPSNAIVRREAAKAAPVPLREGLQMPLGLRVASLGGDGRRLGAKEGGDAANCRGERGGNESGVGEGKQPPQLPGTPTSYWGRAQRRGR